jgi:hypothetical protein
MSGPGQPVGSPCATCQARQPPPQPRTPVPCDFDAVQLICKHCGTEDREIQSFEFKLQGRAITHNLRRSPNRARPLIESTFDVIHDDDITVKIVGGPGPCGAHMALVICPPSGPAQSLVGQREHKFKAQYPNDWVERNLANARGRPFLPAIRAFFYPPPVSYAVDVFSCARREGGLILAAATFGHYSKRIDVYPSDIFGIALKVPSFKKITRDGSTDVTMFGAAQITERSGRTVERGFAGQSRRVEESTSYGERPTTVSRSETLQDRRGTLEERQTLTEQPGGGTGHTNDLTGTNDGMAHPLRRPGALTITHNRGDITNRFQLVAWIDGILGFLDAIKALIDGLKQLMSAAQVGWGFSLEIEFLSGELKVEWGWKEWKKDHQIYRYWKVGGSITVFDVRAEINFGIKILKAEARIFGALTGNLKIASELQANPDDPRAPPEVTATGAAGGEIGVRGALGDWVKVEGKITAGIEGESKFTFAPFKWTMQAYRAKGEGTFTVQCKFWWDYTRTAQLWARAPIGSEKVLIG